MNILSLAEIMDISQCYPDREHFGRAIEAKVAERIRLNVEDRYDELHLYARKVLRYNGVDETRFDLALQQMDLAIQRHIREMGDDSN